MFEALSDAWSTISGSMSETAYFKLPKFTDYAIKYNDLHTRQMRLISKLPIEKGIEAMPKDDKIEYERLEHEMNFPETICRLDGYLIERIRDHRFPYKCTTVHIRDESAIFLKDKTYKFEYRGHIPKARELGTVLAFERVMVGDYVYLRGLLREGDNLLVPYRHYLAQARLFAVGKR